MARGFRAVCHECGMVLGSSEELDEAEYFVERHLHDAEVVEVDLA